MAKNDNTHTLYCTIYACRISEAKSNTCIEKKSRTLSPSTDTCLCMLKQLDG